MKTDFKMVNLACGLLNQQLNASSGVLCKANTRCSNWLFKFYDRFFFAILRLIVRDWASNSSGQWSGLSVRQLNYTAWHAAPLQDYPSLFSSYHQRNGEKFQLLQWVIFLRYRDAFFTVRDRFTFFSVSLFFDISPRWWVPTELHSRIAEKNQIRFQLN